MKNKVLYYRYSDGSGTVIVRIYTPEYFEQAYRDLELLKAHASDCKTWVLEDVEVYEPNCKIKNQESLKEITLEEAEDLAMRTDYAVFACEPEGNEINKADAGAFFLEGYNHAFKSIQTNSHEQFKK